jgi:hypothetical protein
MVAMMGKDNRIVLTLGNEGVGSSIVKSVKYKYEDQIYSNRESFLTAAVTSPIKSRNQITKF